MKDLCTNTFLSWAGFSGRAIKSRTILDYWNTGIQCWYSRWRHGRMPTFFFLCCSALCKYRLCDGL